MKATLSKSSSNGKKWKVVVENDKRKKTIHFGADGYQDYTQHKDPKRKESYISRHRSREDWNDPFTAGYWSRWLLWNLPSLEASIRDINDRFGIIIRK